MKCRYFSVGYVDTFRSNMVVINVILSVGSIPSPILQQTRGARPTTTEILSPKQRGKQMITITTRTKKESVEYAQVSLGAD